MSETTDRLKRRVRALVKLLAEVASEFRADRARRLGAGLAYYGLFALVPTLLLTAVIAAAIVGEEAAEGELGARIEGSVGGEAAGEIESAVADLWRTTDTSGFTLISVVAIVWASSVFFTAWRDMLEIVWGIEQEDGLKHTVRDRLVAMLVPIVFGLLVAAILLLEVIAGFLVAMVDWSLFDATVQVATSLLPSVAATGAAALLFRYSARNSHPAWRSVLPASVLSVVGLGVASWCFGIYVQYVGSESVAGAATSVLVGLVFMYYAAQIMLFGAELIKVLEQRAQA